MYVGVGYQLIGVNFYTINSLYLLLKSQNI